MAKEKSPLDELKKDYSKLEKKYNLPAFENLNQEFQIEKIAECETDYLIREIRRIMADKFVNYLRFIESVLNPVNSPMFVFSIVGAMTMDDKKRLTDSYKKLAEIQINLIEVDIEFSEDKEAEFVRNSYAAWQEVKRYILDFLNSINSNWKKKIDSPDKGYFN